MQLVNLYETLKMGQKNFTYMGQLDFLILYNNLTYNQHVDWPSNNSIDQHASSNGFKFHPLQCVAAPYTPPVGCWPPRPLQFIICVN